MQKILVILILVCAIPAFAADKYVIPHINLAYGFGDAYEPGNDFSANPGFGLGGVFGYVINNQVTAEASVDFIYWITDAPSGADFTMYQVPFFAGVNYAFTKQVGIIGGIGMAYASSTVEVGSNETSDSDTELGFYLGAHVDIDNIIIRPQFVYINTPDEAQTYLQISAGYKFNLDL